MRRLARLGLLSSSVVAALLACSSKGNLPPLVGDTGDIDASDTDTDATTGTGTGDDTTDGGSSSANDGSGPLVLLPRTGLDPDEMGVVINDNDPLSVQIGAYYAMARHLPASNVVHVSLPMPSTTSITEAQFTPIKAQVDAAFAGTKVQAMALTWTHPYAVVNMSITSAFSLGFHAITDTCNDVNSQSGTPSPYLTNMDSTSPFTDLAFRPAMTIPATTIAEAQAIIDHGVASDGTQPTGSAYLMDTSDQTRSARCIVSVKSGYTNECQALLDEWDSVGSGIDAGIVDADVVTGKTDVFLYIEGLASVPSITTNTYLPGAIADHLTSYGGQIPTSGQMSAFLFLKAGATGSYGTVVEPCAYTEKFPDPEVLLPRYFGGATLIEAYWKSVQWPAEGIFLGEPLARPFGSGFSTHFANGTLTIETTVMQPGKTYQIDAADSASGTFTPVQGNLTVQKYTRSTITVPNATRAVYRFRATT
jgi:uncharacterized protein (TIGR03790 family)